MNKQQENLIYFNKWASFYDKTPFVSLYLRYIQKKVVTEINLKENHSILDVACGTGHIIYLLSEKANKEKVKNIKLSGIDISSEMIKKAKSKFKNQKNIKLKIGNVESLPYKESSFDYIITTDAFHHFPNPKKAVEEISRTTKSKGKVIVADINIRPLWLFNILFKLEPGFVYMYSKKEFKELFEKKNLKVIKQKRIALIGLMTIGEKL